jgi:hypothetical protein
MRTWILVGVFLGVFIIAFGIFVFRITEGPAPVLAPSEGNGAAITNIHYTDSYKKGVHTIRGTATVPTACVAFSSTITGPTGSSTAIRIDLTAPTDTGMCLELPTAVSFNGSITADQNVPIAIYANGTLATTTP